jgi:hypothetical protein
MLIIDSHLGLLITGLQYITSYLYIIKIYQVI